MRLIWYQRQDGLWNADCACGATCCGIQFDDRAGCEAWHIERAALDRGCSCAFHKRKLPPCGPKFPETDLNHPQPFVFA